MEIFNRKTKAEKKGYGCISTINQNTHREYRNGSFSFEHGDVVIYDEPMLSSFSFFYKGYNYTRVISKKRNPYTDLGLVRIAGKFGREIVLKNNL